MVSYSLGSGGLNFLMNCTVQLASCDQNSVFTNNVLFTSVYGGEAVRLCTVPYSVQIYDAQRK